ncbi:MAG: TIGR01212 family radical SAM protein, partial [Eubacteriales bacterium]
MWGDKRYNTFNRHLRMSFGEKINKVSLDAGLSCPNRDGTISTGGCVFCSEQGSGDFAGDSRFSIAEQFREVRLRTLKKWPKAKYLAYFQSFSATYGPVEYLKKVYEEALSIKDVVGLSVSTRPDCIPDDVLEMLAEINSRTYLWVELGLQSVHNSTLKWINRGHDFECFENTVKRLKEKKIRVCAHIILGLPCETREQMLVTAKKTGELGVDGIKLHSLHILRNTPLAEMYEKEKYTLMTMEEYINLVVDVLEILPPDIIMHRLMGDGPAKDIIVPKWTRKKWEVLNGIDSEITRRDSWQGKY